MEQTIYLMKSSCKYENEIPDSLTSYCNSCRHHALFMEDNSYACLISDQDRCLDMINPTISTVISTCYIEVPKYITESVEVSVDVPIEISAEVEKLISVEVHTEADQQKISLLSSILDTITRHYDEQEMISLIDSIPADNGKIAKEMAKAIYKLTRTRI